MSVRKHKFTLLGIICVIRYVLLPKCISFRINLQSANVEYLFMAARIFPETGGHLLVFPASNSFFCSVSFSSSSLLMGLCKALTNVFISHSEHR